VRKSDLRFVSGEARASSFESGSTDCRTPKGGIMKLEMIRYIVTGIICLASVGMNSCSRQQAEEKEIIRPVFTMEVSEPSVRQRTFSGTAKSSIATPLAFRVGGKILEIPAKAGLRVKAGDLIARLNSRDYDLQVQQSRAQLAQAAAQLKQSKAEYERVRRQYEANIVSKSALDSQQAAYMSALAGRNASQKGLEMTLQQLAYCTLSAPLAGVIASVPVEVHQTVAAGQTVVTLTAGDKMEIQLGLPEALIGSVSVGVPAGVTFDAVPGARLAGRVSEVGVETDASGTYPIKVRLLEKDARVRPGMVGEATFSFQRAGGGGLIVIPAAVVVPVPSGERYVWVYQPDSRTVAKRMVKIGALISAGLQITAGLKPGEIIVTRGVHQLTDGMKVRLLDR